MELVTDVEKKMSAEEIAEEKKDLIANIDFKMVTFSLAGKDYAIDIMSVKEIAKTGRFTYVPNTAHFVLGVYNLRGDIIPIIDLRLFFNIPIPERSGNEIENMIIVSIEGQIFGVVVDAIDKVVGIQKSSIQPPHPLFGDINIKYIYGVVENADHLYVLLDIESIFGFKNNSTEEKKADDAQLSLVGNVGMPAAPVQKPAPQPVRNAEPVKSAAPAPESNKRVSATETQEESKDFVFIKESLSSMKKFTVSDVNDEWALHRFSEWKKSHGANCQLQSVKDCDEYLETFYSSCTGKFWTEEYCDAMYKALPDNSAKQIHVWNLGCGKGCETYSLACVLKKRYPESKVKIYAHDIDLISISNAPMLTVPEEAVNSWIKPYLTKTSNGANTFIQDIKDSILFEYHDCMNAGNMPASDIIFARDIISFFSAQGQNSIFEQFVDQLKGNGILILGENESCGNHGGWQEKMTGSIVVYTK